MMNLEERQIETNPTALTVCFADEIGRKKLLYSQHSEAQLD